MKAVKLLSMVDFILEIDCLTTKEFCDKYSVPVPTVTGGVNDFLQVDAIKHRMFVEYAKFLNNPLKLSMFVGEYSVFEGFEVAENFEEQNVLRRKGGNQVYSYLNTDKFMMKYPRFATKVGDLSGYDFYYYDKVHR